MKKLFIFAAIAAAGLLTSCSSDDNLADEGQSPLENSDGQVAIQIGVGSPSGTLATRGTGTAGGTGVGADANIWRGERVHVLMYKITDGLPTFEFTKNEDETENLYDNTSLLVTPLKAEEIASGIAKEPTTPTQIGEGATFKVKYYPINGQSDFWGYYLGGYGDAPDAPAGPGTVTAYTYTAPTTGTNPSLAEPTSTNPANVVATHFVIDGTHDLLVGNAPWAVSTATDGTQFRYSAKAARKGVHPTITFNHLLSRLKFKAVAGNPKADGIKITAIKVRSKNTGEMIVAYKYKDANAEIDYDNGTAGTQAPIRIAWDATQQGYDYNNENLPQLELKRRITAAAAAVPATYKWQIVTAADWSGAGDNQVAEAFAEPDADATLVTANLNKIYKITILSWQEVTEADWNGAGENKVADALTTNEAVTAALVSGNLGKFYKITTGTDPVFKKIIGTTTYKKVVVKTAAIPEITEDQVGKMLALAPVALTYGAGSAETYKWENSNESAYTTAKTADASSVVDVNENYDSDTHDAVYRVSAYKNKIIRFGTTTPYTYKKVVVDAEAVPVASSEIGEALLVAPQAKYEIEVDYDMDAQTAKNWYGSTGTPQPNAPGAYVGDDGTIHGVLKTDLVRSNQDAFEAGYSYLVTITLYGPEEIVITTTLTAWQDSGEVIQIGQDE